MLKYLNFDIFLTAIGIISVAHATQESSNLQNHISETPVAYSTYVSPLGLLENEILDIEMNIIDRINMYRKSHGCDPLILDQKLINHAREKANNLAQQNYIGDIPKDENEKYGQTIFASAPWKKFENAAVDAWCYEMRFINEGDSEEDLYKNREKIGNMIQLFWKKSKYLGIGVAKNNNNQYFIVAEYNPKGNIYPLLLVNLPSFTQKFIEATKTAQDALEKRMKNMALITYLDIEKPIPGSNNVFAYNSSQVYTFGNRIVQSDWEPSPNPLTKAIMNPYGGVTIVKLPPEHNPVGCKVSRPHQMTPKEVEEIRRDVLEKSNHYRDMYKIPRLKIHNLINCYAQKRANYLAVNNLSQHKPEEELKTEYGENIHTSIKYKYLGELAVDIWYYEVGSIKVPVNDNDLFDKNSVGNVTQLLWMRSKQMGVGAAVNANGDVIVVANFNPGGNIDKFFIDNLPSFTQEQIDEGRSSKTFLNALRKNSETIVPGENSEPLPGWTSYLHAENRITSESEKKEDKSAI